ncbi:MAG: chemotaxis protein CheD [Firmicutes bacterium]|nr:chemotaxis protein CheD [Bacillota bacterium]MDD4693221.1 chemotaxis protein CheD [Bacillota bacterium]
MKKTEQIVNLGEIKLAKKGVLTCYGLGSCVAVALYDPNTGIGGLCHIVLPRDAKFSIIKENKEVYLASIEMLGSPAKFADSGLIILLNKLERSGAKPDAMQAKITGGARLLPQLSRNSTNLDVGKENVEAVEKQLEELKIPIVARDVGGNTGRTIRFHLVDGTVEIRRLGLGKIVI